MKISMVALFLLLLQTLPACPTEGWRTSLWGRRVHPITKRAQWHRGLDIGAPKGTEIHAMWAGRISRARQLRHGYGNYVVLETPKHKVLYAHLSKILVEKGAHVKKGDLIGLMGESGRATGPHLHLEVRKGRRRIDPDQFLGHCPDLP